MILKAAPLGNTVKVPEGLWFKCNDCGEIIYKKDLEENLHICPKCNYHFRIDARIRLSIILDKDTFKECDSNLRSSDPLKFKDIKKYSDRLKAAHKSNSGGDAIVCGEGNINGKKILVGVFNFGFMGGSMGSVVGEKITRLLERGLDEKCPVIIFSSSGGARMHEGILSLMQMAKTSAAVAKLKEKGILYISVLTDPTTGGVTASFAMLGDVIMAEPNALIGFAGPRVIKQTINQELPEGFQRSEYLMEHGMLDLIVDRREMKGVLSRIIDMLTPDSVGLSTGSNSNQPESNNAKDNK